MEPFLALAAGAVVGAVGAWIVRELLERREQRRLARAAASPTPGEPGPTLPVPGTARVPATRRGDEPTTVPAAPGATQDPLRLSARVIVHLYLLGRLGPDDVGTPAATQRGICAALGADQSVVSRVLARLAAAGVVEVARRHVRGGSRRLNVYALTRRGELIAHDLRRAAARSTGNAEPGTSAGQPALPRPP